MRAQCVMAVIGAPAAAVMMAVISQGAEGSVIWDEVVNGDLSNDRLNPTALSFSLGVNSLMATSVQGDREYVSIAVPVGMQLSAVNMVLYAGLDETAFIGVQAGSIFSEPATGANVANILGYTHFGPAEGNVGTDILDDMGIGAGAIGFTGALSAGTYTFWIQQAGTSAASYQFDFVVEVPVPGVLAVMGMGLMSGAWRRRRW